MNKSLQRHYEVRKSREWTSEEVGLQAVTEDWWWLSLLIVTAGLSCSFRSAPTVMDRRTDRRNWSSKRWHNALRCIGCQKWKAQVKYTLSGDGASLKRCAATRKQSGCGLPRFTSGSSELQTAWSNRENSCWCRCVLRPISDRYDPVANAIGMLQWWRCLTSRSAPTVVKMQHVM